MAAALSVTSGMFSDGGRIPREAAHPSVGGDNTSPDLSWSGLPDGTLSLAVTCYDPDAPTTVGFSHLVLFDIPADTTSLAAGAAVPERQPRGSVLGYTDFGERRYGGMAPPPGAPHRYQFTVFALGVPSLEADGATTYAKFRFLIREHTLASGTLTGLFSV